MMKNFSTAQMLWLKSVLAFFLVIFVTGCGSYFNFMTKKQKLSKAFSKEQSADLLMQLAPEDAYLFLGELHFNRLPNGPILLVAVTDKFSEREISALSPFRCLWIIIKSTCMKGLMNCILLPMLTVTVILNRMKWWGKCRCLLQ